MFRNSECILWGGFSLEIQLTARITFTKLLIRILLENGKLNCGRDMNPDTAQCVVDQNWVSRSVWMYWKSEFLIFVWILMVCPAIPSIYPSQKMCFWASGTINHQKTYDMTWFRRAGKPRARKRGVSSGIRDSEITVLRYQTMNYIMLPTSFHFVMILSVVVV